MKRRELDRRQFLQASAAVAGAAVLSPWALTRAGAAKAVKRTATDQVPLGKTGLSSAGWALARAATAGEISLPWARRNSSD